MQKDNQKIDTFIFKKFELEELDCILKITYFFEIPGLESFKHYLEIPKNSLQKDSSTIEELVFHIGLVELISYWKCCCPKKIIVECGYLDENQKKWFKKLYFYGLGEFFYQNKIQVDEENFVELITTGKKRNMDSNCSVNGCMIAVGGGKDSCVTLELLKDEQDTSCFMINPKKVMIDCAKVADLKESEILKITRKISPKLLELNKKGYLNGHIPFSAVVAFISYLTAYLNNKKYIVLSNESSANESNVKGTKINHQYSKSYEFENDFSYYVKTYFKLPISYFSLLRPLSEYQIAMLFSRFSQYHSVFKSCNLGSKEENWKWCCTCPKCLFVFSLLSPFLYKEALIGIFNEDLFEKQELLPMFQDLLGYGKNKPFECVGTYEEVNYAITKTILNQGNKKLPFLLQFYKENYLLIDLNKNMETFYNNENNLNAYFEKIVKEVIFK